MTAMPRVPKDNVSPKGVRSDSPARPADPTPQADENRAEQGRQGNIRQNTTNQGYQQDR